MFGGKGKMPSTAFGKYIVAHWRGEQSLTRSFFLNGIVAYLMAMVVLVALIGFGNGRLYTSQINFASILGLIYTILFPLLIAWSLIGIVRAAINVIRAPNKFARKLYAVMIVIAILVVIRTIIDDLVRLDLLLRID